MTMAVLSVILLLIKSKSHNFPYENMSGQGKIMLTIVDGKIVFNDRSFNIK